MSDTLQDTTLTPGRGPGGAPSWRAPSLTVLSHPDPRRVGERVRLRKLLMGEAEQLSRVGPTFETPEGEETAPLRDRYVSRQPVELRLQGPGLVIDAADTRTVVKLDGRSLLRREVVPLVALERGLVLELADRVALLLHWLQQPGTRPARMGMVGESEGIDKVRADVERWAQRDLPVLIRGESGTGKELVARAIHNHSARHAKPFVAVNIAAIPPSTAPAELFGHSKGAFSGAGEAHAGYFGRAHGGTLFLDEIGETPGSVQPVLLRVLESGEIQPVGGRGVTTVDVRLITATDADLEAGVEGGGFRRALLHRLSPCEMRIPPLRERRDDIPRLLLHFLAQELMDTSPLETDAGSDDPWLPSALVARLVQHDWPGNVRELRNIARRIAVHADEHGRPPGGDELGLPATSAPPADSPGSASPSDTGPTRGGRTRLSDISDEAVASALKKHDWHIARSAEELGVSKTSLYQLIDRNELLRKAQDLGRDEIEAAQTRCGGNIGKVARELRVSRRGLKLRMTQLGMD